VSGGLGGGPPASPIVRNSCATSLTPASAETMTFPVAEGATARIPIGAGEGRRMRLCSQFLSARAGPTQALRSDGHRRRSGAGRHRDASSRRQPDAAARMDALFTAAAQRSRSIHVGTKPVGGPGLASQELAMTISEWEVCRGKPAMLALHPIARHPLPRPWTVDNHRCNIQHATSGPQSVTVLWYVKARGLT